MVPRKGAAERGKKGVPLPRNLQWWGNSHVDLKSSDTTDFLKQLPLLPQKGAGMTSSELEAYLRLFASSQPTRSQ